MVNFEKYDQSGGITLFGESTNFSDFVVRDDLFYYSLNELQGGFEYKDNRETYIESFPLEWHHKRAWKVPIEYEGNKWRIKIKLFSIGKNTSIDGLAFQLGPRSNILDSLGLYLLSPN